ncbi:MAG: hypothetical protein K0Q50_607 [Vampirovibrio sp.]|jgi:hypothetical protein|nr:hypothetical protein [Vampirovibrio sp.]
MTTVLLTPALSTPAKPQPKADQEAVKAKALQSAANANTLAEDALKQISQLQSAAQNGDTFALKTIQSLATQALAQAGEVTPAGGTDALTSAENASYIAQSALKKIGSVEFGAASQPAGVGKKFNQLA